MVQRTEFLITRFDRNNNIGYEIRVQKGVKLTLLLERLICRDLDNEEIIASCLRKNHKRAHDPFQIIDMREEHRREQAQAALKAEPNTDDPIGIYNRARQSPIPLGKTLLIAGVNHDFFVKEVEA